MDIERHTNEPGMAASGVNSLKTFHAGNVVALACLQPMSAEYGEDSDGVLVTGGGENTTYNWKCDEITIYSKKSRYRYTLAAGFELRTVCRAVVSTPLVSWGVFRSSR